jgi:hypothetical protein
VTEQNGEKEGTQSSATSSGAEGNQAPAPEVRREVAVVGTAPNSRKLANDLPDTVEIWGLNDCYTFLKRWDRWFEIHNREVWEADGAEHVEFLQTCKVPVYMLTEYPDIPNSVAYPYEEVKERLSGYLASTVDYMLALAIAEGVDAIHVIGVNMATETEFTHQRPSCEYWLGMAQGAGIKVHLPENSPMLKSSLGLYGPKKRGFLDRKMLRTRADRLELQRMHLEANLQAVHGAQQQMTLLLDMVDETIMPGDEELASAEAVIERHRAATIQQVVDTTEDILDGKQEMPEIVAKERPPLAAKYNITEMNGQSALAGKDMRVTG